MPQVTCPVCGKSFHVPPARIRNSKSPVCCSRECRHESQRKHPKKDFSQHNIVECACGCGETFRSPHGRNQAFKHGHGRKSAEDCAGFVNHNCDYCEKPYRAAKQNLARFKTGYCCRKCAGLALSQSKQKDLTCENCGIVFTLPPSKKQGEHTFCCYNCYNEWRKKQPANTIRVKCDNCETPMDVYPSKFAINEHFYCSKQCRAQHILGENNPAYRHGLGRHIYYGSNWKSQRRKAIKRDGGKCRICGKTPKRSRLLHVHHITPASNFKERNKANKLSNLITVCHRCHKRVESGKIPVQRNLL